MRYWLFIFFVIGSKLVLAQTAAPVASGFQAFLNAYYEDYLKLNPTVASQMGNYRYNDQLENTLSQPYRQQMQQLFARYVNGLKNYQPNQLSERDRLSYQIFRYNLDSNLEAMQFPIELTPLNQMGDFRLYFSQLGPGSDSHPFKSVKDYDDFLKRINDFVAQTDTAIANLRKGIAQQYVHPKVVIEKVLPQLNAMLVDEVTKSLFYTPVKNIPVSFPDGDKQRLTTAYTTAIRQQIIPAYKRLFTFLENEYLPRTRQTISIEATPNGKAQYASLVKRWTTTNMTPDEVHALGLSEVKRIRQAMEGVKQQVGFTGDLKSFFQYVFTDRKFFPFQTEEDVLAGYQQIYQRMKPQLPSLFNTVPKTAFEIRAIEKYRAAASAAHYMRGTPDGSRPGVLLPRAGCQGV